jgi:hypothetical protein
MTILTRCTFVLILVLILGASTRQQSVPFSGEVRVDKVTDSIWWHCEFVVHISSSGAGKARLDCKYPKKRVKREKELEEQQVEELRELLRKAKPFEGQFWGIDARGWDAALVTLSVFDDERYATLVCSQNKSFDTGPRRQLIVFLDGLRKVVEETERSRILGAVQPAVEADGRFVNERTAAA